GAAAPVARARAGAPVGDGRTRPRGGRRRPMIPREGGAPADGKKLEGAYEGPAARWGHAPPLPEFWGGYVVTPVEVELWQGRPNRLHDRVRYRHVDGGGVRGGVGPGRPRAAGGGGGGRGGPGGGRASRPAGGWGPARVPPRRR